MDGVLLIYRINIVGRGIIFLWENIGIIDKVMLFEGNMYKIRLFNTIYVNEVTFVFVVRNYQEKDKYLAQY